MNVVLLSFSLEPQLEYSHHRYGKQPLFLETSHIIKRREPPREEAIYSRQGESKVRSHGQLSGCFLALLEAVWLLCCFCSLRCVKHTPWRKQGLPSQLKALSYSSCLITNYVTSTHLNPHAEGLQTIRESDETAKSQFTLNISQIATNHRHCVLSEI